MLKRLGLGLCLVLIACIVSRLPVFAASSLFDFSTGQIPFQTFAVTTSGTTSIILPENDVMIVQTGFQADGTTPSVSTDQLIVMTSNLANGTANTMVANLATGVGKIPIFVQGSASFRGFDVPAGPDGNHEIQCQCVGHGCTAVIIKGAINTKGGQ